MTFWPGFTSNCMFTIITHLVTTNHIISGDYKNMQPTSV